MHSPKSSRQVSQSTLMQFLASQCPDFHSVIQELYRVNNMQSLWKNIERVKKALWRVVLPLQRNGKPKKHPRFGTWRFLWVGRGAHSETETEAKRIALINMELNYHKILKRNTGWLQVNSSWFEVNSTWLKSRSNLTQSQFKFIQSQFKFIQSQFKFTQSQFKSTQSQFK